MERQMGCPPPRRHKVFVAWAETIIRHPAKAGTSGEGAIRHEIPAFAGMTIGSIATPAAPP
jgi:hypothetical protein